MCFLSNVTEVRPPKIPCQTKTFVKRIKEKNEKNKNIKAILPKVLNLKNHQRIKMAAAVIRVKRRITDEPFDKFVLNCKRIKTGHDTYEQSGANAHDSNEIDNTKTILKLAATVSTEDDIKTHITRLRKADAEEIVQKTRKPDRVIQKLREQFKDESQKHRFKVVNCFRSIDTNDLENMASSSSGSTQHQDITVVDVIKEDEHPTDSQTNEVNTAAAATASQNDFVYDLYVVQSGEQPTQIDINNYTIRPFDDLVYQINDETLKDSDHDSEDSNDEANWRNEYPDTDDGLSIEEDDMRRAVEDLNFSTDSSEPSSVECMLKYADDPVIHFMNESEDDENEYDYFKKHGHVRNHAAYYRRNRRKPTNDTHDDDDESDIDDNPRSNSSASTVSPLASCDESNDE